MGVVNPGLGPLENNRGPTKHTATAGKSRHRSGKRNNIGALTDQRGSMRPFDALAIINSSVETAQTPAPMNCTRVGGNARRDERSHRPGRVDVNFSE